MIRDGRGATDQDNMLQHKLKWDIVSYLQSREREKGRREENGRPRL